MNLPVDCPLRLAGASKNACRESMEKYDWKRRKHGKFIYERNYLGRLCMKKFWAKNKEKIITLTICGVLFIGVLSIFAAIGGTLMKVFGFEYKSVGSMLLFFLAATVLSFPLNLFAEALPKVLLEMERIGREQALMMYLVLDIVATSFGLIILDHLMTSVSATKVSIVIISFLWALPGKGNFKEKEN